MLFNSLIFLYAFLPVAYIVFWTLRTKDQRYIWLAITGYIFYSFWNYKFCSLMLFSTLVSFVAGIGMLRTDDTGKRRWFPRNSDHDRPRAFGLLQICKLCCRERDNHPAVGGDTGPFFDAFDNPACRDLVLHVSHDHLHRGQLSAGHTSHEEFL